MYKKNDLCERLLKFAVDVILYLRIFKFQVPNSKGKNNTFPTLGAWDLELETWGFF